MVVVQLIHRLTQADISCTTMARLFFFPQLVGHVSYLFAPLFAKASIFVSPSISTTNRLPKLEAENWTGIGATGEALARAGVGLGMDGRETSGGLAG